MTAGNLTRSMNSVECSGNLPFAFYIWMQNRFVASWHLTVNSSICSGFIWASNVDCYFDGVVSVFCTYRIYLDHFTAHLCYYLLYNLNMVTFLIKRMFSIYRNHTLLMTILMLRIFFFLAFGHLGHPQKIAAHWFVVIDRATSFPKQKKRLCCRWL